MAYFYNDTDTLHACSLTSRPFLHACRTHLFATITISDSTVKPGTSTGPNFKRLLQTSPHIAPYVQTLELQDAEYTEWLCRDTSLEFCIPLLVNLKALLLRIQVWDDEKRFWALICQGQAISFFIKILSLRSLVSLDLSWFPHQLLQHCQHLDWLSLSLGPTKFGEISPATATSARQKLSINHLHVECFISGLDGHSQDLVDTLRVADSLGDFINFNSIKKFSGKAGVSFETHQVLWQIMQGLSATLENLVFLPCIRGMQDDSFF